MKATSSHGPSGYKLDLDTRRRPRDALAARDAAGLHDHHLKDEDAEGLGHGVEAQRIDAGDFKKLLSEEKRAYLNYRRIVDNAYEPIQTFMRVLRGADALAALEDEIKGLEKEIKEARPSPSPGAKPFEGRLIQNFPFCCLCRELMQKCETVY